MDEINTKLDQLGQLTDEDLAALEGQILSEFEGLESGDTTPESVESMTKLADALDAVRAEVGTRSEAAEQLFAAKEAATSRIQAAREASAPAEDVSETETPEDAETAAKDPEDEEPVADEETPVEDEAKDKVPAMAASAEADNAAGDAAPVPVPPAPEDAAAASPAAPVAAANAPETVDPAPAADAAADPAVVEANETPEGDTPEGDTNATEEKETPVTASGAEPDITPPADRLPATSTPSIAEVPVVITAGADIPGTPAGSEIPDMLAVANGMVQRMHAMRRTSGGDGEQHIVASLQAEFPEERILRTNQQDLNADKIQNVTSTEALVAAGGLCAPVNVRYDLFGLGDLGRPVKDSLAPFNADRGGIRFVTPPTLADFAGAVALWTVQDDIDASTPEAPNPVKPCVRINCGSEVTVLLDAITLCLTFGNLGARAYPEMVKRNNELGLIQHARFAETRLLTRIGTLSTSVSAAEVLGAARDYFVQVEKAAAAYRSRHRMGATAPLRVIAPIWLKNMIRADIVMQLPGDGLDNTFTTADAQINAWFRVRNINVTWHIDGESGQIFGAQTAGALNTFPTSVVWYLFAEGTFLFLDGGTLDLGLVRDSTLNGTNDYKMFVETFEGVAKVGIESLRINSQLKVNGSSSGTRAISGGV